MVIYEMFTTFVVIHSSLNFIMISLWLLRFCFWLGFFDIFLDELNQNVSEDSIICDHFFGLYNERAVWANAKRP